MNQKNYQKEMERVIGSLAGKKKTLLLHSCCAPCSTYCLELLREFFKVTVFYYNPNLSEAEEYERRAAEQKRLIEAYNRQAENSACAAQRIGIWEGKYEPNRFFSAVKGFEACPEGGARCVKCFELRLEETAKAAKEGKFDYFTTTLTISPLKNAGVLNEIGQCMGERYGVPFLPSDFKKKEGYKRSAELSGVFGLYRQDYCGCVYSKEESRKRRMEKEQNLSYEEQGK